MGWHLTWQDPVALVCVILSVALAWWLHRRLGRTTGCASCSAHDAPRPTRRGRAIPVDELRLGRPR